MPIPLRILLLQDHPARSELILDELSRAGFAPVAVSVKTRAEYLGELDRAYQIILADRALPDLDALDALKLLKDHDQDTPFIIIAQNANARDGIECMRQGAADYLFEEQRAELGAAIRRALDAKRQRDQKRWSEQAIRNSEKRLRVLIENSSDGIALLDADATYVYASPAINRMLGYSTEELVGRNSYELLHPDEAKHIAEAFNRLLQSAGETIPLQFRCQHKDGSWRCIDCLATNSLGEPEVQAVVCNYRDVTERKRAQDALRESEQARERIGREMTALYERTNDLASQHELPDLLQTIIKSAAKLLDAPGSAIYLFDAEHSDLELAVVHNMPLPVGTRITMGEGMAGRVALTQQPLIVDDYQAWQGRSAKYEGFPITAVIEVPMLFGGETIGVLTVHHENAARKFTDVDVRLLSLFAIQAASAVHNARLYETTKQRVEQLALVYDAGLTLNRVLDPKVVMEFLLKTAGKTVHADRVDFFRYDPQRQVLVYEAGSAFDSNLDLIKFPAMMFALGEEHGLAGRVAAERVPLYLPDVQKDPYWIPFSPAIRSALWTPVIRENELRGVLSAMSTHVDAFTPADQRLVALFANQLSSAMENARLFQEMRGHEEQLTALNRIANAVNRTLDLDELLELVYEQLAMTLKFDAFFIALYDGAKDELDFRIQMDEGLRHPPQRRSRSVTSFTSQVINTKQPLFIRDWEKEKESLPPPVLFGTMQATHSWLGVPMLIGGAVVGVISVQAYAANTFTEADQQLLVTIADQVAVALQRTILREQGD